jgi:hypothetical protein
MGWFGFLAPSKTAEQKLKSLSGRFAAARACRRPRLHQAAWRRLVPLIARKLWDRRTTMPPGEPQVALICLRLTSKNALRG